MAWLEDSELEDALNAAVGLARAKARLAELAAEAVAALAPFGARADALREAAAFTVRRER